MVVNDPLIRPETKSSPFKDPDMSRSNPGFPRCIPVTWVWDFETKSILRETGKGLDWILWDSNLFIFDEKKCFTHSTWL